MEVRLFPSYAQFLGEDKNYISSRNTSLGGPDTVTQIEGIINDNQKNMLQMWAELLCYVISHLLSKYSSTVVLS